MAATHEGVGDQDPLLKTGLRKWQGSIESRSSSRSSLN